MASTLADTLVDDGAEADIELQQKIDADLANLSLEDLVIRVYVAYKGSREMCCACQVQLIGAQAELPTNEKHQVDSTSEFA